MEGLLSLQRCANVKEQRFYVHPHQIAKQGTILLKILWSIGTRIASTLEVMKDLIVRQLCIHQANR